LVVNSTQRSAERDALVSATPRSRRPTSSNSSSGKKRFAA
jgi:hypothetical protein